MSDCDWEEPAMCSDRYTPISTEDNWCSYTCYPPDCCYYSGDFCRVNRDECHFHLQGTWTRDGIIFYLDSTSGFRRLVLVDIEGNTLQTGVNRVEMSDWKNTTAWWPTYIYFITEFSNNCTSIFTPNVLSFIPNMNIQNVKAKIRYRYLLVCVFFKTSMSQRTQGFL